MTGFALFNDIQHVDSFKCFSCDATFNSAETALTHISSFHLTDEDDQNDIDEDGEEDENIQTDEENDEDEFIDGEVKCNLRLDEVETWSQSDSALSRYYREWISIQNHAECPYCPEVFRSKISWIDHFFRDHQINPYQMHDLIEKLQILIQNSTDRKFFDLVPMDQNVAPRASIKLVKNEASIVAQMEKNLEILNEMERNGQSAMVKPAEYLVAKNVVESINPTYIRNKDLYDRFESKMKSVLYPPDTADCVQNIRLNLENAESELSRVEVHKVDLSGQTILEATNAVNNIFNQLLEVKNNLKDLIRIKRELTKNDFLQSDADFSSKLDGLRKKFNDIGDQVERRLEKLTESSEVLKMLKITIDETDQWASEVIIES